jgi:hypothetical protein
VRVALSYMVIFLLYLEILNDGLKRDSESSGIIAHKQEMGCQ